MSKNKPKIDKEKLFDNPTEWGKARILTRDMQREDRNERHKESVYDEGMRHQERIEGIFRDFVDDVAEIMDSAEGDFKEAYQLLVQHGVIKDGDPAPWEEVEQNTTV